MYILSTWFDMIAPECENIECCSLFSELSRNGKNFVIWEDNWNIIGSNLWNTFWEIMYMPHKLFSAFLLKKILYYVNFYGNIIFYGSILRIMLYQYLWVEYWQKSLFHYWWPTLWVYVEYLICCRLYIDYILPILAQY